MKKAPAQAKSIVSIVSPGGGREMAFGGGLEGAERTKRETVLWSPPMTSPDRAINPGKKLADARGKDMVLNDGYTQGAVRIQKDSIVGARSEEHTSELQSLMRISYAVFCL